MAPPPLRLGGRAAARSERCRRRSDCAASSTRAMRPERRAFPSARAPGGASSTSTSSPCMAPLSSFGGMKRSSSRACSPFGRTKPNPSRCRSSLPASRLSRVARTVCACVGARLRCADDARSSPASHAAAPTARCRALPARRAASCAPSCSSSRRRSRPPPSPSSRTSCL